MLPLTFVGTPLPPTVRLAQERDPVLVIPEHVNVVQERVPLSAIELQLSAVQVSAPTLVVLETARLLKPPVPEHVSAEHVVPPVPSTEKG
jgi:hypothetical protein